MLPSSWSDPPTTSRAHWRHVACPPRPASIWLDFWGTYPPVPPWSTPMPASHTRPC